MLIKDLLVRSQWPDMLESKLLGGRVVGEEGQRTKVTAAVVEAVVGQHGLDQLKEARQCFRAAVCRHEPNSQRQRCNGKGPIKTVA